MHGNYDNMHMFIDSPTLCRIGPHKILDDPLMFSAVILKVYSKPVTRSGTSTDVVSVLSSLIGLIAIVESSVRGSPPVWMYDQITIMMTPGPLDDTGALHVRAGTVCVHVIFTYMTVVRLSIMWYDHR